VLQVKQSRIEDRSI